MDQDQKKILGEILEKAREAAVAYYELRGAPLGITGEVGEFEAARLLGLKLAEVRKPGYDATDRHGTTFQIKTRALQRRAKNNGRVGSINLEKEWDKVLLVLLDQELRPTEIWEATRASVTDALLAPGSKARNERGALAISKFKSLGERVWSRDGNTA